MNTQYLLERFSGSPVCGADGRHGPTVTNDDEGFPAVFYVVQYLGEPARCLGGTELLHKIRLSDRNLFASAPPRWTKVSV